MPFKALEGWIAANEDNKPELLEQLRVHLDDLNIIDADGNPVLKEHILSKLPPDPPIITPSNFLLVLDAAVKSGDMTKIEPICREIERRLSELNVNDPTNRRLLASLVAGIPDIALKNTMGLSLSSVKVPTSRHIEAYRQMDKKGEKEFNVTVGSIKIWRCFKVRG